MCLHDFDDVIRRQILHEGRRKVGDGVTQLFDQPGGGIHYGRSLDLERPGEVILAAP